MGEEMREIKFKIWDKKNKRWYIQYPNCNNLFNVYKDGTLGRKSEDDDYIFVEYTGLKNRDGKEIWEVDILIHYTRKKEVYFAGGCFCVEGEPLETWGYVDTRKIIGNVFENPELMEGK